jgi:hypothetical protein
MLEFLQICPFIIVNNHCRLYILHVCSPFVNMPARSDENGQVRKIFP